MAQHHLEQLRELGLVAKQDVGGHYVLVEEVKIGILRHFVKLGRMLFPRYLFYAIFSTTLLILYFILIMQSFTRESLFIMVFGLAATAIFWYETMRVWSMKPF
ncbi:MAG: hypothetical protein QXH85_01215 [Candidatus Bathyarchaeia archaeon]